MSKILKNTTGSIIDLDVLGLSIAASSQITINEEDYLLLGSNTSIAELTTLINSGDIVVNNGIEDISTASEALDFLKYPDSSHNIYFNATSKKFDAKTVFDAINEIREKTTKSIDLLTSSLNGNHDIDKNDSNVHVVSGSATGYSVTLPDATQLFTGRVFQVVNQSSETISIKDKSGTNLTTLITGDTADFTLEQNSTAAGLWLSTIITSAATGITSYVVASDTTFTTTNSTDTIITGFLVTPASGRYSVSVSCDIEINNNNAIAEYVVYAGGAAVTNTRRLSQGVSSNFVTSFTTIGEVSVNGSQQVDVRVNINTGSLDINNRSLILIRLGA